MADGDLVKFVEVEKVDYLPHEDEIVVILTKPHKKKAKLVAVQPYFNLVGQFNEVTETVTVDFIIRVFWQNKEWIGKTDEEFQQKKDSLDWEPTVEILNGLELDKKSSEIWLDYEKEGIISRIERYIGTLSFSVDLQKFPFDRQVLSLQCQSFWWFREDMRFVILPSQKSQSFASNSCVNKKVLLQEWDVEAITMKEKKNVPANEGRTYSMMELQLHLKRRVSYYFQRIFLILILTVTLAFSVLFISPDSFSDRTSILVTLFLAAVAVNFVINTNLPKISYSTKLDIYINVSYLFFIVLQLESVITFVLEVPKIVDSIVGAVIFGSYVLFNLIYLLVNLVQSRAVRVKH